MKTFIIIIIIGCTRVLFAQTSFSLNFTDTAQVANLNDQVAIQGTFTNSTVVPIQMSMQLLNLNLPSDWQVYMCDPINCYPPGILNSNFTMSGNQSAPVFVDFLVGNIAGIGTLEVRFENLSNGEVSIWILKVDASAPTSVVSYSMEEKAPILIEWFSLQGQPISNIKELPRGVYIKRLSFENGTTISSKVYCDN